MRDIKNIIIVWIGIQLIVIGLGFGLIGQDLSDKTYNCNTGEWKVRHTIIGMTIPLIYFTQVKDFIGDYCEPILDKEQKLI